LPFALSRISDHNLNEAQMFLAHRDAFPPSEHPILLRVV
jgi:hypothetical protein